MSYHLRRVKSAIFLAAILAVALSSAGCASGPSTAAETPAVSCILLSSSEIGHYGASRAINPFSPRTSLLQGTPDEFVVLQLNLSLAESTRVAIAGSVQDAAGNEVARLQSLTQMQEYWRFGTDLPDREARARVDTLARYYAPSLEFVRNKGRPEYIVVLMGKKPLPRPASILVSVTLSGGDPQLFSFPLPDRK